MLDQMTRRQFNELLAFEAEGGLIGFDKLFALVGLIGIKLCRSWGCDVDDLIEFMELDKIADEAAEHSPESGASAFKGMFPGS